MLLSKVHVQLQIWKVGGAQTKYGGHTCLFPRDNVSFTDCLPLLPADLDTLVITNRSSVGINALGNHVDFTVKRQEVLDNLTALRHYHPSYCHVIIDHEALVTLPENGSVFSLLRHTQIDNPPAHFDPPNMPSSSPIDNSASHERTDFIPGALSPNITSGVRENDIIADGLADVVVTADHLRSNGITQPPLRTTPINEHNTSLSYLIDAFPFLFPTGQANLNAVRRYDVKDAQYFRHLLKYKDRRFARHP
jgi:hypothetical protein